MQVHPAGGSGQVALLYQMVEVGLQFGRIEYGWRTPMVAGQTADRGQVTLVRTWGKATRATALRGRFFACGKTATAPPPALAHGIDHLLA